MRGEEGIRTLDLRSAEPALSQLSYNPMVRDRGVEPRVSRSQSERVSRLPRPGGNAPGRPRAGASRGFAYAIHCEVENLQRRRPQPGRKAGAAGLEPATFGFGDRCSTS